MIQISAKGAKAACGAAALIGLTATSVQADDYPYAGIFWSAWEDEAVEGLPSRCALSFLEQRKDGNWFAYHVDLEGFKKNQSIRYLQISNGHCTFDAALKVETCVTQIDKSYVEGEGKATFDIVKSIGADRIETLLFEKQSDIFKALVNSEEPTSGIPQNFLRCPFTDQTLLSLTSPEFTRKSPDEIAAIRVPSNELLSSALVDSLVEALHRD
jgi:hypothetical protein